MHIFDNRYGNLLAVSERPHECALRYIDHVFSHPHPNLECPSCVAPSLTLCTTSLSIQFTAIAVVSVFWVYGRARVCVYTALALAHKCIYIFMDTAVRNIKTSDTQGVVFIFQSMQQQKILLPKKYSVYKERVSLWCLLRFRPRFLIWFRMHEKVGGCRSTRERRTKRETTPMSLDCYVQ